VTVLEQPVRARLDPDGHQVVVVVVDGGYHPNAIIARADLPLRVVFIRDDGDACFERVIFSSPHMERRLTPLGATAIELPAQPPGQVRFTCGFGRYRGRIELIPARAPSLILRLRSGASRLHGPGLTDS
jgi:plastocyanin domain-containing protein